MMKKFITIVWLLILTTLGLISADKQFYFIGKYGRLGSLSQEAQGQQGIYLRWDLIEGELPSGIRHIKLVRIGEHNQTLLDVNSSDKMSAKEIAQMFQSTGSQRRAFEIIDSLSKSDNPNCSHANIGNIGEKILSCLEDNYWSFLASRVNFDIARARYRAYLDTTFDKQKKSISYVLLGGDGTQEILLGKTTVNLKSTSVLSAKEFKQVIESKCNDNRYGLDDYRVGLSWKNGGENATEFFANGLMVSGYDLYYSTRPLSALPRDFVRNKKDLATIAMNLPHLSNGALDPKILKNKYLLAKANETLITIGEKDVDGEKPLYIESMQTLKDRGFKPGEERYYFLVPRDFTGNYGKTIYTKVVIPDLLKPAKPVNPRIIEDSGRSRILWDHATPENYLSYHSEMKACPDRINNRVTFVEKEKSCQKGEGVTLNFNIDRYDIYRFDNSKEAAEFEDKNLNGIDDQKEKLDPVSCQAQKVLSSDKYNRRIESHKVSSGEKTISIQDTDSEKGQEYWYRIVSVTKDNITSEFTMPIRAFVPKRELLDAPEFNVTERQFNVEERNNNEDNERQLFIETSINNDIKVEMEYAGKLFKFVVDRPQLMIYDLPNIQNHQFQDTYRHVFFRFYDINGSFLGSYHKRLDELFKFSSVFGNDKQTVVGYRIDRPLYHLHLWMKEVLIKDGDPTRGSCVSLNFDPDYVNRMMNEKQGKIEVSLAMGNGRYKLSQSDDLQSSTKVCAKESTHDLYPIGVSIHYDNGQMTYPSYFNFIPNRANLPKPNKPALVKFEMNPQLKQGKVFIKPQIEKVTGTMLYLYNRDKNISTIKIIPHLDKKNTKELIVGELNVSAISKPDTWCIKAKTIGLDGQVSEWSTPLCQDLTLQKLNEDLLAWPKLSNGVVRGGDLNISSDANGGVKITLLTTEKKVRYYYSLNSDLSMSNSNSKTIAQELNSNHVDRLSVRFFNDSNDTIETMDIDKSGQNFNVSNSNKLREYYLNKGDMINIEFKAFDSDGLFLGLYRFKDNVKFINKETGDLEIQYKVELELTRRMETNYCALASKLNQHSNLVIYRSTIDRNHKSNFVQVSPLIEDASCDEQGNIQMSNNLEIVGVGGNDLKEINYIDKYPYVVGEKYQYVILFFNSDGEVSSYSLTNPAIIQIH
jgi:hypothetical protein